MYDSTLRVRPDALISGLTHTACYSDMGLPLAMANDDVTQFPGCIGVACEAGACIPLMI
jgi:hypothetical protein